VNVIGDLSLFPEEVQYCSAKVMKVSQEYDQAILNIMLGYTSRHEMVTSIKTLAAGVEKGLIKPEYVFVCELHKGRWIIDVHCPHTFDF
jgi:undecaprenyl diphosphate synthase